MLFFAVLCFFLFALRIFVRTLLVFVRLSIVAYGKLTEVKESKERGNEPKLEGSSPIHAMLKGLELVLIVVMFALDLLYFLLKLLFNLAVIVVFFLFVAIIGAAIFLLFLNDNCSTESNPGTKNVNTTSNEGSRNSGGNSESAGQGEFTDAAKEWAKNQEITFIGDSLGVGVEPKLKGYFPNMNFDSKVSRFLENQSDASLSALETLKTLRDNGSLKPTLVVAIGTNGGLSTEAMERFYKEIPDTVKKIVWINTASQGGGNGYNTIDTKSISETMKSFVSGKSNMRYLDWEKYVSSKLNWSEITSDTIHMNDKGYDEYSKFITQGLYDLYGTAGVSGDKKEDSSKDGSESKKGSKKEEKDSESGSKNSCIPKGLSKVNSNGTLKEESNNQSFSGEIGYPYKVNYHITQGFGMTNFAKTGIYAGMGMEGGMHPGVDIQVGRGTDIISVTDGEVFATIDDLGISYIVVVKVKGGFLSYEHLLEPGSTYVKEGQKIKRGDLIGHEGGSASGNVDAFPSHLHLQYNAGDTWTLASLTSKFNNPKDYLKGWDKDKVEGPYYEEHPTVIDVSK